MTTPPRPDSLNAVVEALKPCPFCGGEAASTSVRDGRKVQCMNQHCFASGPLRFHGAKPSAEEAARAAWNARQALSGREREPHFEDVEKAVEKFIKQFEENGLHE